VSFKSERPLLKDLREVSKAEFSARVNHRVPTFVETDYECADNSEKKSPGDWGAI
jgi:hypothetical protein